MATYKLIQDIEAEDHILGPLSLRQFIYALVAVFFLYISFICLSKGVAFLLVLFLPPALFFGFFAFPFGKDQSTEIWALAKIRFFIKPRRRIWDQSGIKELVTITVPRRVEQLLTDGLNQNEVQSRLAALASTIDSRGWAIKNVNVGAFNRPNPLAPATASSDRLIDPASMPRQVPNYDVQAADDILDETSNPVAQQFDSMINASSRAHRQQLVTELNRGPENPASGQRADYWFMAPGASKNTPAAVVIQPGSDSGALTDQTDTPAEAALAARLRTRSGSQQVSYAHLRTLRPLGSRPLAQAGQADSGQAVATDLVSSGTVVPDPAILSLANNNDLNVATLAREAHKAKGGDELSDGEVVISLH